MDTAGRSVSATSGDASVPDFEDASVPDSQGVSAHESGEASPDQDAASVIDPRAFAALIADASDEQLEQGVRANRDLMLGEIFKRMPEHVDAEAARTVSAVIEWEIGGPPEGTTDHFRVAIGRGACTVSKGPAPEADVCYRLGAVDFLKLVAGVTTGPKLFLVGRLRIRGDLVMAARIPGLLRPAGTPRRTA